ncbi:MAG: c-type cytochrome [Acidiferrobacterales bacterium]
MQKLKIGVFSISLAALFLMEVSALRAEQTTRPGMGETQKCESCHGSNGCEPLQGLMPKLCGQNQEYLVMTLEQFRDGTRPSPIMHEVTKNLSDELIQQLADYFAHARNPDK